MFILQGSCLHLTTNTTTIKEAKVARIAKNGRFEFRLQPPLSRAELVLEQACNNGDNKAIIIQNGEKHLITSPGFPDEYPQEAL